MTQENTAVTDASTTSGTGSYTTTVGTGAHPEQDYKALYEQAVRESAEWKNRFAGLQGKYQQEQNKWLGDTAKLMELQGSLTAITGEKESLNLQLEKLKEDADAAMTAKELMEAQLGRITMVTTEFPELVPFLQKDLIPDASGDELRTKLGVMKATIEELRASERTTLLQGSSPSETPAGLRDNSPKTLMAQALDAMRAGKMDEYDKLYSQYLEASKKEA